MVVNKKLLNFIVRKKSLVVPHKNNFVAISHYAARNEFDTLT